MSRIVLIIIVFVVFLLGLVFHIQNDHLVIFNYLIGSVEYHFSVFMVLSFAAGALVGMVAMSTIIFQLRHRIRKLNRQVMIRDKEVTNLRSIPYKQSG